MEGLKLIDLGNEVSHIDVDTSKVPYTFSVKLGDRTFAFSIRYNEVGGFFTVDLSIASTGEVLVYGDIVRYGRPLFNSVEDERFPVPVIMPLCLTGDKPELALTIQREDGFYAACTCLTLDMAYNNARLICRPETSWIKR